MNDIIEELALSALVEAVPEFLSGQDKKSGKFLPTKNSSAPKNNWVYSIYDQSPHYPLALLYKTSDSRNPYYRSAKLFAAAVKGADSLADSQGRNGGFKLVIGGKDWGYYPLNWQVYHWLRTYELLRDDLDVLTAKRWEKGLKLAVTHIERAVIRPYVRTGRKHTSYNHIAWYLACVAKAGQVFGEKNRITYALKAFKNTAPWVFDGCGQWRDVEPDIYSIGYSTLTLHAVSLLQEITKDRTLFGYIRKTVKLLAHFSYSPAKYIETLDFRMRYGFCGAYGLNAFLASGKYGRIPLLFLKEYKKALRSGTAARINTNVPLIADLIFRRGKGGFSAKMPFEKKRYFYREKKGLALVNKYGEWQYSLSAYCPKGDPANVYTLEAQSHVSAYNHRTGLIIGGGNSKHQPEFSNFTFKNGKDYRAKTGSLKGSKLRLNYDSGSGEIEAQIAGKELVLRTSAKGEASLTGLQLQALLGGRIQINGRNFVLGRKSLKLPLEKKANRLVIKGKAKLLIPSGGVFVWPVKPHNPYTADNKTGPAGWVSFIYLKSRENEVRVRI